MKEFVEGLTPRSDRNVFCGGLEQSLVKRRHITPKHPETQPNFIFFNTTKVAHPEDFLRITTALFEVCEKFNVKINASKTFLGFSLEPGNGEGVLAAGSLAADFDGGSTGDGSKTTSAARLPRRQPTREGMVISNFSST